MQYRELKYLFVKLAACNSCSNDLAAQVYLHCLLGAFFKNKIIRYGVTNKDLRVHCFWFQLSRSGKDQLNKILRIAAEKLGLKVVVETDITGDAALIGSIDGEAQRFNMQHGLSADKRIVVSKTKNFTFKDPVIKGDLADFDIVIVSEGKIFFQTNSEKLLTVLQPALDYPGHVRKKMKDKQPIEYPVTATLVVTSIPFEQMKNAILEQGFFQRLFIIIRRLSIDEIEHMRSEARKLRSADNFRLFGTLLGDFSEAMKDYNRDEEFLTVSDECEGLLAQYSSQFTQLIRSSLKGGEVMAAMSFTQTAEDIALKIAGHIALINKRNVILPEDVKESFFLVLRFVEGIVEEIEVSGANSKETALYEDVLKFVRSLFAVRRSPVLLSELVVLVKQHVNCGTPKARKIVDTLHNMNYLRFEHGEGHSVMVSL